MTGAWRLGTRGSALALAQSRAVAARLAQTSGRPVELVTVTTAGDTSSAPLHRIGGTGVFTSALRAALTERGVDLAVHSLKDLPTAAEPGLALAAVPEREDPRDAVVSAGDVPLSALPVGARVGTGSPRRAAQLRAARPDLQVVDLRGNVPTRVDRVDRGDLDAVVLAAAGLRRLGLAGRIADVLDPQVMLPAPGQGALAVECRADDDELCAALAALDDPATRAAVTAERALLARLQAGCTAPVGALAGPAAAGAAAPPAGHSGSPPAGYHADGPPGADGSTPLEPRLALHAVVVSPDGRQAYRSSTTGPAGDPAGLGRNAADDLLRAGAAALVAESS